MPFTFKISERAQVVLILILALAALVLAWHFLLWPQFERRSSNRTLRESLVNSPFANLSVETLQKAAAAEKTAATALDSDWSRTARRLTSISNTRSDPSHIDFQVEHAAVRMRLGVKARNLNIALPNTFDISPGVTSTEIVRERLNQLKTVEKLVDLVISQHIRGITRFKNLPTVNHYDAEQKLICEEYPVEIEFTTHYDALFYLFSSIFEEDRVFVFNKIRVTSDPTVEGLLHVKAVTSSLIFP